MENTYLSLKELKRDKLGFVENKIKELLNSNKNELQDYFNVFLFSNPKRLRPLFIFLICDLLNFKINDDIINLAVAVELLHSASLIHDDIIDDAELRRGKDCLHNEKGNKIAVLAGDYLLSLAGKVIHPKTINFLFNAANLMAKSEINNLLNRFKTPSLEDYIQYSKEKTSTLFTSSVKSIYALNDKKEDEHIINFAEQFSLCFQIRDDINNYLKKDKNKSSNDCMEGIYTLPCIFGGQKNYDRGIIIKCSDFLKTELQKAKSCIETFQDRKEKQNLITLLNLLEEK